MSTSNQIIDPLDRAAANGRRARLAREAAAAIRRRMQRSLFNDVAETAADSGAGEPGAFLAAVMAGRDPRASGQSRLIQILSEIRDRGPGEQPTPDEWSEVADLIWSDPRLRGEPVGIETSTRAAEKLLPYLYPRADVEPDVEPASEPAVSGALTDTEIDRFRQSWQDDY